MIISKEDQLFLIRIWKEYLSEDFDIFDVDSIKDLFKMILLKLKEKYQVKGLLDIEVYVNSDYGMIMEIENIYAYGEEFDVTIHFHLDSVFLCEINSNEISHQDEVYYYHDKFYSNYKRNIDSYVIYKDCLEIMEKGIKIC